MVMHLIFRPHGSLVVLLNVADFTYLLNISGLAVTLRCINSILTNCGNKLYRLDEMKRNSQSHAYFDYYNHMDVMRMSVWIYLEGRDHH